MGKKRKAKETLLEPPRSQTDVTKDIDDIFAARKRPTAPTKSPLDSAGVGNLSRESKPNAVPVGSELVSVRKQVQDAKSKLTTAALCSVRDDEFADLRGTNKSIYSCDFLVVANRQGKGRRTDLLCTKRMN